MEFKTCEEYVLSELDRVKNVNWELEEDLKKANDTIEKLTSNNSVKLIDEGGTIYYCDGVSVIYYNDILRNYDLTPQFLEDCLKSNILLDGADMRGEEWANTETGQCATSCFQTFIRG